MKKFYIVILFLIFISSHVAAQVELVKINSRKTEFSPSLSAEGKYIVFQSDKDASAVSEESEWKLYNSHLQEDSTWSAPVEITNINDNVAFVAGPSLSYDGNTLYFTAFIEGVTESEDIYYSNKEGETWSKPISIGSPINTDEGFEGFPSLSADENSIYFIKVNEEYDWDKKNKESCFTIFVAHKSSDGKWDEPKPLPAPINLKCERSPRILADNKTLVFSSIREGGKGSFDLYQSTLIGENQWSEPIALDFLNTKESDLSPSIPASGDVVYYNASGDIVKAIVPENFRQAVNITVHGEIVDKVRNEGIKSEIQIIDLATGEVISKHHNNEKDGRYSIVLQSGGIYRLTYNAENYDPVTKEFDLSDVKSYEEREENISLEQFYNLNLSIEDAEIESKFPASIVIQNFGDNGKEQTLDVKDNKVSVKLPAGLNYQLVTSAKNYYNDTIKMDLANPAKFKEQKVVKLKPKKVPVSIGLTNMGGRSSRKIQVENERTGEVIEADANQVLLLRSGDRYKVIVNSEKGYAFASDEIDLTNADSEGNDNDKKLFASTEGSVVGEAEQGVKIEIPMTQLKKGTHVTMEQILFETNSADITESSKSELEQLVDMLKNNPTTKIEIAAHTDDVGSDVANLNLSQKRAQSVANYLYSQGIGKDRYTVKGYGETKPRVPNTSTENRAKNRRVEFIITE